MAQMLRTEPDGRTAWGEYTHICLDKQLPCLYPFPQRSQRSSAMARLPSLLTRGEPSLARRLRFLVVEAVPGADAVAVAASGVGDGPAALGAEEKLAATEEGSWLTPGLFILREKYEGGVKPEGAPTELDSTSGLRPLPRRLAGMGMAAGSPLGSLTEAATAAATALAAAVVVTLLRRVMRWLGFTAPSEMEWEWCRELWEWGRGRERDNSC